MVFCRSVFLTSACALEVGEEVRPKDLWFHYKDMTAYIQPSYVLVSVGVEGSVKAKLFTWAEFVEAYKVVG